MRTLRKLAAALLVIMLAASSAFAVVYGQAGYETEGYDEAHAWEIDSAETLIKVRDDIYSGKINTGKYYRLTADIDLREYRDWIPIGPDEDEWNYNKTPFNGVFDGGNHTITVYIARTNQTYTGLFGVMSGGTIKNLKVSGRVAVSNRNTGYAWSGGYSSYVGGIVAYILGGRVENCTFDGTITGTHSDTYDMLVGGIAGANRWDETVITNCKVGGKDSSTKIKSSAPGEHSYASGIIGYFTDYNSGNEISNNYSRVTLEAGIKQNRIYGYRDGTSGRVYGNSDVAPGGDDPSDETIEAVSITTASLLGEAFVGQSYSTTFTASGTTPITWSLTSGKLPEGLTFAGDTVSGTPTKEGTYSFTLSAANESTYDTREFFLTVTDNTIAPAITSSSYLGQFVLGDIISIQLQANGTEPIKWRTEEGSTLPAEVSLSSSGVLYGAISEVGSFSFGIYAANSAGEDYTLFTLDVMAPTIVITTDSTLPEATAGEYYTAWFYVYGENLPSYLAWVWSAENLPGGLEMDSSGYIRGTPTTAGTYSFPVTVKNGNYSTVKTFVLTVNGSESNPPEIVTSSLPDGRLNKPYSYQLEAESDTPVTWTVDGLYNGLSATSDGLIYGTLTASGTLSVTVTATNEGGQDSRTFTLNISELDGIPIDAAHFPDDSFRSYVSSNLDTDGDMWLDSDELNAVTYINVYNMGIASVKGIEYFTELTNLTVWMNNLTELDLSANNKLTYLDCDNNQLEELDLSNNTALKTIHCDNNRLEELDLSGNTELEVLWCQANRITELNLSANLQLRVLCCRDNQLEELDLSSNTALVDLSCYGNKIPALDLSANVNLNPSNLSLSPQNLTGLDVKKYADSPYYVADISGILGENLANVFTDSVRGYGASYAETFDPDTGKATFYSLPECVIYEYNTGFAMPSGYNLNGADDPSKMIVFIYPSDKPEIVTETLPAAIQDNLYSTRLEALSKTSVTWDADDLPDWLDIDPDTGVISGTPDATGDYTFTAIAAAESDDTDGELETSKELTITVNSPVAVTAEKPSITTQTIPNGKVGERYNADILVTGTAPLEWTVTGLPSECWYSVWTEIGTEGFHCTIGSSRRFTLPGPYTVTVTVTNSAGSDSCTYEMEVEDVPPTITTTSIPDAHIGTPYGASFTVVAGSAYTWEFSGTLPEGVIFNDNGTLSGTPAEEGTFTFTLKTENDFGSDEKTYTLKVNGDAPSITTVSIDKGRANEYYTATFTATGSEPITWDWSGNPPDGITFDSGTLSGTPTMQGRYTFSVIASNSYGTDSKTFTLEVEQSVVVAPKITTAFLPAAKVNESYSAVLSADGTAPITWSVSGDVPAGLTLSESGTISGIPTEAGVFQLTVKATNAAGESRAAVKTLALTVNGIAPSTASFDTLPEGSVGVEYSTVLSADGTSPITWSIFGALPKGLSLDVSSGRIYGTPEEAGSFNFSVTASNIAGMSSGRRALTIRASVPSITTEALPSAMINTSYDFTLEAEGSAPMIWNNIGTLPRGLTLNADGIISGVPTVSGSFDVRLTAANSAGVDSKDFTIFIEGTAPTLRIRGEQFGYVTREYSALIETTGTKPVTISVTEGTLPDGLTLNTENSTISGTLAAKGQYTFTLTASNVADKVSRPFTITVYDLNPPAITTTARLPDGYIYEEYNYQLSAEGTDVKWSLAEGSNPLPTGLKLDEGGLISGAVMGSATTYTFRLVAENSLGRTTKSFSLRVKSGTPSFKSDTLKTAKWNKKYAFTLKLVNFKATEWTIVGDLPEGIKFNRGKFSGKPTEVDDYDLTIIASNGAVEVVGEYELKVQGVTPKIKGTLKKGSEGVPYTSTLKAKGVTPITWDIDGLPDGLDYEQSPTGETCTISGTPLKAFSDKIDVRIDNGSGDGQYIGKKMKLTIKALKPQFETRAIELATWKAGVPIDFDFKLSVKPVAVTWECLGNLPEGFTFDTDNGRLYGTTNETGRFVFTVIAKNANKLSAKKALNIIMVITDDTTPAPANDPEEQEPEFVNGIAYYERGELTTDMMAEIANSGEIVAAVLPAVEVEESGMYEFTVSLDMAAPEGGLLVWHSFPDGENDDSDSDNAIFLDDSGETIERVPESYTVTVSAWLEPGVIYEPVIAVRIKD